MDQHQDVTTILNQASAGEARAVDELLPLVREELRQIAAGLMHHESAGHTLQPTALVHEAYLKMIDQSRASFVDRAHFLAVAAGVMRRLLVDHARGKGAAKRGGAAERQPLHEVSLEVGQQPIDLLALDDALVSLHQHRPRAARIVELRFFGGLTIEQVAAVLEIGSATVEREWRLARATLYQDLLDE